MESGGRSGETAGVVQGSIGRATEAVKNLVAGGPGAVSRLAEQSRERFQRADAAIGRRLGNGIFYIWGGVALAAIGVFFYGRRKERTGADEAQAHPS